MKFYHRHFSRIYVEKDILQYLDSNELLQYLKFDTIIPIDNYKDIFSRPNQSFNLQKKSKCLILANKTSDYIYDASKYAQHSGFKNFFYNTLSLNCLYDCSYCYLQGMFSSSYIVAFINISDYFDSTKVAIKQRKHTDQPLFLSLSYDTDLLAFENIIPYCRHWIDFACNNQDLIAEIRTKSSNFRSIADIQPNDRILLAWTLSPELIASRYENDAPAPNARLAAVQQAISNGWSIRLCFDPVIAVPNWRKIYQEYICKINF